MVVLDTDIIIDHLRQLRKGTPLDKISQNEPLENLAISMITVQELYEGKSTKNKERETELLATIAPLKILPYTREIAELAGKIARDLPRYIEATDAAIAATTIINSAKLLTLNTKDFRDIKNLELVEELTSS